MDEPRRARRRRIREKLIKKVLLVFKKNNTYDFLNEYQVHEQAKKHVDNFKKCSCYMCGNPRKNFLGSSEDRMTIQEQRDWLNFIEQIDDVLTSHPTNKRPGKIHG
ncbi:MAG: hypothetical protein HC836_33115 [Richelia sp. RM2_1_2]|nr:hypothetical protein [Richelia sp. RM2_1_2]